LTESIPRNKLVLFSWVLLLSSFFWLFQLSQSGHVNTLVSIYSFAFTAYVILLFQSEKISPIAFWVGATVLYSMAFWQLPYLSNDYFRFLWDGEMIQLGINPFDFTPNQLIQSRTFTDCYYLDLYAGMGELSRSNYSCYPTVNQFYFYASTLFSNDIGTNVFVMRALVFLSLLFGLYHLKSLLSLMGMNEKRIYYFILNPLVVLESMGNLHFELVTVAFLLAALNLLLKQKLLFSALLFAAGVHVKLIPLLLLPFLLSYLGCKKALLYYIYSGIAVILLSFVFLSPSNINNFIKSLQLYFRQFEFNSFLLYPYLRFGILKHGWNLTSLYAPQLAKWALLLILGIAWNRSKVNYLDMLKRMFWGVMIYYFLTTTVHPWYWILPLTLSIFHFSWSVLLASFFAIFSYGIYEFGVESDYRQLLAAMNIFIMVVFLLEIINPEKWKRFTPKFFLN
jgi:alpha-1,6-mannosyltransferase|tara:strand:- start:7127 stop:8479 length:1353 start_codon:yes stop_codon:yes gene_type:complete